MLCDPRGMRFKPCLGGLIGGLFPAQRPRLFTQHRQVRRYAICSILVNDGDGERLPLPIPSPGHNWAAATQRRLCPSAEYQPLARSDFRC